jgi:hypothetical protein
MSAGRDYNRASRADPAHVNSRAPPVAAPALAGSKSPRERRPLSANRSGSR